MKFIKYIDQLSTEPKLSINGNSRYVTNIGALMTILTFLAILILAAFFLNSFFEKKDLAVLNFTQYGEQSIDFDLNHKPLMFKLYYIDDEGNEYFINKTIATVEVRFMISTDEDFNIIPLEYEKCLFDTHVPSKIYKDIFPSGVGTFNCIKPNKYNLNLTHVPNTRKTNYINIYIADCVNSTEVNNCAPEKEISETLRNYNMYFSWIMPSVGVDHTNVTDPIQLNVKKSGDIKIFYDFVYSYANLFKKVVYSSDDGFVFQEFKDHIGYQFYQPESNNQILPRNTQFMVDKAFTVFQFLAVEDSNESFKRSYPKIQSIMANIGGVMKMLMTIGQISVRYITNQMMVIDNIIKYIPSYSESDDDNKRRKSDAMDKRSNSLIQLKNNFVSTPVHGSNEKPLKSNTVGFNKSKNLIKEKKYKLSFWDAVCVAKCTSKTSAKRFLDNCYDFYNNKVSVDNFLIMYDELRKFKKILFTDAELNILNEVKIVNKENNEFIVLNNSNYENFIKNFNEASDPITKRMIKMLKKDI